MALSQAAYKIEQLIGNGPAATIQDVTNPGQDGGKYGHPTEKMQALSWQGKNSVKVSK